MHLDWLIPLFMGWYSWPKLLWDRGSIWPNPVPADQAEPTDEGDFYHHGKNDWTEAFDADPQYFSKLFCCVVDVMAVLIFIT